MTMADEIAVMTDGRIDQLGSPTELYERPATAFVAGFLGLSNLIPGTVDGDAIVTADGIRLRTRAEALQGRSGAVRAGFRPEKVTLAPAGSEHGAVNALRGVIKEYAYVGVATQYVVDTPAGEVQVFHQNATPGVDVAAPGTEVTLTWDPEATFVVEA